MRRTGFIVAALALLAAAPASARDVLHVYGPGGPAPAIKEAARQFGAAQDIEVDVVSGPTAEWADRMKADGDVVYSGSEAMMSDFLASFGPTLQPATVKPLYLRPAGILVRPGNPRHIRGFADLLKPGMRIAVVVGAGQQGLWEDIAGRDGDIATISRFRKNVVLFAANTGLALKAWQQDAAIDAWVTFPIWAIAHPGVADVVPLEPRYRLFRDSGIVMTQRGAAKTSAKAFAEFLISPEGEAIFRRFGWAVRQP